MADTMLACIFPLHNLKYLHDDLKADEEDSNEFKNYSKYLSSLTSSLINRHLVISGPRSICRSSLLFQACLSMAMSKREVVYICQNQFEELPYFVHNMPRPTSELLKLINFKYLSDGEDLINYISSLHTEAKLPSLIAVESLQNYVCPIKHEQESDRIRQMALMCAHLIDTVELINTKSFCGLVVTCDELENDQFMKLYFDCFARMQTVEEDCYYQVKCVSNQANRESTCHFRVLNSSIKLEEFSVNENIFSQEETK